jgi:ATP-binding cassette, subfamily B, bacterial
LGRTGSGKTSLTRLLFRFYDPDQGAIRIGLDRNGSLHDLRSLPLAHLRSQVGMITQNVQLFNASVRDNLTFFDPSVSDEHIWSVIHDLGMQGWFRRLPDGLETVLESGGSGLSAGEAQLLALMRIFLKDPGMVVLDEASSHLDPATEHLIDQAVDRLVHHPPRTALIVAHRLATVQRADEIMILDEGRIVEHGPRTTLANDPHSLYRRLLETGLEEVLA